MSASDPWRSPAHPHPLSPDAIRPCLRGFLIVLLAEKRARSWRSVALRGCAPLPCKVDCKMGPWSIPGTFEWWAKGFCSQGRPGPLGFCFCGRLPRHGVVGFMFNSSSSTNLKINPHTKNLGNMPIRKIVKKGSDTNDTSGDITCPPNVATPDVSRGSKTRTTLF